jgi:hypothetical protein
MCCGWYRQMRNLLSAPCLRASWDPSTDHREADTGFLTSYGGLLAGASTSTARLPLSRTHPSQKPNRSNTEPAQQRGGGVPKDEPPPHNPHTSGHKQHRFPHPGRVPEEYGLSEDLAEIVANWDSLPDALKAAILAKVREAVRE